MRILTKMLRMAPGEGDELKVQGSYRFGLEAFSYLYLSENGRRIRVE